MNRIKSTGKSLAAGVLLASISLGAVACSPDSDREIPATRPATSQPIATPSPTPTLSSDAVAVDKTVDAFFVQLREDTASYEAYAKTASRDGVTPEQISEALKQHYAKSIAYIQPGTLDEEKVKEVLGTFATMYLADSRATISGAPENYVIDGSTAKIYASDLTVILRGSELPKAEDTKGGFLTLGNVDGKWMISGFSKE